MPRLPRNDTPLTPPRDCRARGRVDVPALCGGLPSVSVGCPDGATHSSERGRTTGERSQKNVQNSHHSDQSQTIKEKGR